MQIFDRNRDKQHASIDLSKEVLDGFVELDDEGVDECFAGHITLAGNGILLAAKALKALGASLQHLWTHSAVLSSLCLREREGRRGKERERERGGSSKGSQSTWSKPPAPVDT